MRFQQLLYAKSNKKLILNSILISKYFLVIFELYASRILNFQRYSNNFILYNASVMLVQIFFL